MSRDIINIPDNIVQKGISGYRVEDQDVLQWAVSYGRSELGNSRDRLCQALGCHWSTLFKVLTGTYGASIDGIILSIRKLQELAAQSGGGRGFVHTVVTKRIHDLLDYALAGDLRGGKIVMISGPTGRSKTEAVREWCRNTNHGRSIYVDCPESGGMKALFKEIARRVGVNSSRPMWDLRDKLIESFNRRRILVLDEVARLLPGHRSSRIPSELEFVRRLHDTRHCAIAIIATPIFDQEMRSGWLKQYLEQLLGRLEPLEIPAETRRDECRDICRAFCGSEPDAAMVAAAHAIANSPGRLRVLFDLLDKAAALAKRRGEPLAKKHLDAAAERRRQRGIWPEDVK